MFLTTTEADTDTINELRKKTTRISAELEGYKTRQQGYKTAVASLSEQMLHPPVIPVILAHRSSLEGADSKGGGDQLDMFELLRLLAGPVLNRIRRRCPRVQRSPSTLEKVMPSSTHSWI